MKIVQVLLILSIVAIAGCVGQSQEPSKTAPTTVQQTITEPGIKEFKIDIIHAIGYSPNAFTVNQGDTVMFLATTNPAAHRHMITIDEFNVNQEVTATSDSNRQVIEFVADKSGTFKIYCKCDLPGVFGQHPWMTGTLIVQ